MQEELGSQPAEALREVGTRSLRILALIQGSQEERRRLKVSPKVLPICMPILSKIVLLYFTAKRDF